MALQGRLGLPGVAFPRPSARRRAVRVVWKRRGSRQRELMVTVSEAGWGAGPGSCSAQAGTGGGRQVLPMSQSGSIVVTQSGM